jgi:hypothetical protein
MHRQTVLTWWYDRGARCLTQLVWSNTQESTILKERTMATDTIQSRKMTLGNLLEGAMELYQQNLALFVGVVAVIAIPQAILRFVLGTGSGGGLSGLLGFILTGALIQVVATRLQGKEITVGEAYSSVGIGTFAMLVVAMILAAIAIVIGFVLLIIPGFYLLIRFLFVSQAIVLERKGIFEAFSRSGELVSGFWWRVFGYAVVLFLLVAVIQGFVGAISGPAAIIAFIVAALIQPFSVGVLTLLYYDLRREKEGVGSEGPGPIMGDTLPV